MAYTVEKLIAIAEAEIGYLEKESNAQLDDKTANAGYNNWTKYARDLYKAGYYNGNKNGFAWCDVFVDWCFYQLCGKNAKIAQDMICQTGTLGAGVLYSMGYYKNANRFYKTPVVGDQIFFGTGGNADHTGIVYKVTDTKVHTIEGNARKDINLILNGGGVLEKIYDINDAEIMGYGRPKYEVSDVTPTVTPTVTPATSTNTTSKGGTTVTIELTVLRKGAKGEEVKTLQRLLKGLGYNMGTFGPNRDGIDGDFGNTILNAVRAFQASRKLSVDGVVGKDTWTALLKG